MSFLWSRLEPFINTDIQKRKAIDNLGVSKMDVWQAVGREALLDNPEQLLANIATINYQQLYNKDKISKEQFEQHYPETGLEYDPNMTEELVEYLLSRKKQREINQYIIARGKGGLIEAAGSFGSAVLSSFASPINIAASFIPIGGQLWWAKLTTNYGRLATTAAKGGVSGAVFQAGLEPLVGYSRNLEQRDYGTYDSLANIAIAASFGAAINSLGYGASKLSKYFFDSNGKPKESRII